MRMTRLYQLLSLLLLLSAAFSSCIRDNIQPCPPLQVMIDIKDKNYSNIDFVEQQTGLAYRVDETGSFRNYIKKLFYALYDLQTGETVLIRHLHDVTGDAAMATVYIPEDLPFGRYGLVVWGNINSEAGILGDGLFYDLHMGGVEGYDVYMTAEELLYDEWNYNYVVELERLKGELLIQAEGFPDEIGWSKKLVSNVMGNVDYGLHYSDSEDVTTQRTWGKSADYVSNTYIAPSASEEGSEVKVLLYDSPEMTDSVIELQPVTVTMRRNEITVLRYVYNADIGTTNVFVLLNDGWNEIVDLEN